MDIMNSMGHSQIAGLQSLINKAPTKVIAITGGKGGVGKTNISVNLAVTLAKHHKKVMLFDADLGLANIDVLLGLNAHKNLSHVLNGEVDLKDIILTGPAGIKIIPSASGIQRMCQLTPLEQSGIIQAFGSVSDGIDLFIIDTAAGISSDVVSFVKAAQEVIMVVCNEPTSITDAYATIKLLSRDHGVTKFHVIANMVANAYEGTRLFSKLSRVADKFLDVNLFLLGAVPFDACVRKSVQRQETFVEAYPGAKSTMAIREIAEKILAQPIINDHQGGISFFLEQLLCNDMALLGM
jgi:flagellar biosynthesis protein FlhG